jgi:hypothetical protein
MTKRFPMIFICPIIDQTYCVMIRPQAVPGTPFFSHLFDLTLISFVLTRINGRLDAPAILFFWNFKRDKKDFAVYMVSNIYTEFFL